MATVNVGTCAEFISALNSLSDINITADLDFNEDPYYRQTGNFANLLVSGAARTINGNNHTLSNIYIRPQKCFIKGDITHNYGNSVTFNNLKFEFITNNSTLIHFKNNKAYTLNFNNCEFNCRAYSLGNTGDDYPPIMNVTGVGAGVGDNYTQQLKCTNCVFNIYISTSFGNNYCILRSENDNPNEYTADLTRFESCIFKIRNGSDKRLTIIKCKAIKTTISNSAIFYNDVGNVKPTYEENSTSTLGKIDTDSSCTFANSYIAAFGDVPSDEKPIFLFVERNADDYASYITTSFYDKNKIKMGLNCYRGYWNIRFPIEDYANGMKGLTTTECKSSSKLSEIGYIFCEEI